MELEPNEKLYSPVHPPSVHPSIDHGVLEAVASVRPCLVFALPASVGDCRADLGEHGAQNLEPESTENTPRAVSEGDEAVELWAFPCLSTTV